jgi:hypothetical protein
MILAAVSAMASPSASCGIDPDCRWWRHGHALVLATPNFENGETTLYRVGRELWGIEKAPPELMLAGKGYARDLPYGPRPVENAIPVVGWGQKYSSVTTPNSKETSRGLPSSMKGWRRSATSKKYQ